jgi:hypothetical protein
MFFNKPAPDLPKITAPTAAEVCEKSKPSPQGKALLQPKMTPPQYLHTLEKNKLPVDSVHFLAHGMPEKDSICWACQSCRVVGPKLSMPEMDALKLTEAWLKNPLPDLHGGILGCLGKVDFTGPAGWAAQAAAWVKMPGMPPGLVAAAVAGAILLAAGLKIGPAMPQFPQPKMALPMLPLAPEMMLKLLTPLLPVPIPVLDQAKLVKLLFPFIDLGKGVAAGSIKCC